MPNINGTRSALVSLVQKLLELVRGSSEQRDPQLRWEYEVTIRSILLGEDDPAERFVNHLWYTIIDQRRDVKDFVIPMIATLMLSGFNLNYALSYPNEALEIITAVLTAYGHELKYSMRDNDLLRTDGYYRQRTPSRSEAVIKTIQSIKSRYGRFKMPWQSFKDDILRRRAQIIRNTSLANQYVQEWPFVSSKSFRFFLRDIEPILSDPETIPIPIDSNVAHSIQKTGLMFDEWPPNPLTAIPIDRRGENGFEERITQRVKQLSVWNGRDCGLCEECCEDDCQATRMVYLAQTLFLLGAEYCHHCCVRGQLKTVPCPIPDDCMLSTYLDHPRIPDFIKRLEEKA